MKVFCLRLIGITLRATLVFLSLCFASNCIAQQTHENKSLDSIIKSAEDSQVKVDALIKQGYNLIHYDPKQAEKYSKQAIAISNEIHYDKGVASAMLNLAKIYRENGRSLQLSMEYTIQAVHIFDQIGDKKGLAQAYFEMGYIHKDISNYPKAIDNFSKSLKVYQELKLESNVALCRLVMGHVNVDKGMATKDSSYFKKAFKLYNQVLEYRKKTNSLSRQASALTALANLYLEYFRLNPKPEYLYTSIEYSTKSIKCFHSPGITSINVLNLGEAYYGLKQTDKALSCYQEALKLAELVGDPQVVLQTINKIIEVEKDLKHYDKIFDYSKKFINVARQNRLRVELKKHYRLLAEVYLAQKDYENAYKSRLLYEKYSDSILNEEKAKAIVKSQVEFESEKKDKEIELLNQNQKLQNDQLKQQQMTRNFLIATIILICFLLVVIYSRFVVKRKAHHLIEEKNQELEKLSIVARETATGVFITSSNGEIEWFNEGFSKLFKWESIEEYREKKGRNIYDVSGNSEINEIIKTAVEQRKSVTYENWMAPKTGSEIWIQTTLTPIFDKNGILVKLVFVETDVTELKSAKETAELALEIQEQFLANTSHEIRTPMNGIMGIVRHLKETPLTSEQESYLNIIAESSNNLLHVVNDILDISKIRAGKIIFEWTEFRLSELFNALRITQLFRSDEKGIYLKSFIDPKIPEVLLGDPVRLNQILLNLVGNAIKFTDSGGVLFSAKKIKSQDDKVIIEFSVVDTGIGIAHDKLDYVFESFTQAESHINRRYGGTGLGLSIAKSMIEQQNGTLAIHSELGKGSKLTFTLEFEEGNPNWNGTTLQNLDGIPMNVDLSDLNILLVEDNHINQIVALFELNKWRANTDVAESAEEAFKAMNMKNYDVILMDISMPEMDGLEATRHIRSGLNSTQKDVPIIAMTASALVGEKDKCFEAGMNDYISKPFHPVSLYSKIVKWGRGQIVEILESLPEILEKKHVNKVINLEMIYERAAGNMEYVREMIQLFLKEMPGYIDELNEAYLKRDEEMLMRVAHKMASPSALFGANQLTLLLREIEVKSKQQEEITDEAIQTVKIVFQQTIKDLNEELKKLGE